MRWFHRLIIWFRSWAGYAEVSRSMSTLTAMITRLKAEKDKSDKELQEHRQSLRSIQDAFEKTIKLERDAIARAEGLNKQLQGALDAANDALKTANEIVIPGLVAANKVFIERWSSESQIHAMRLVAARKENAE